MNVTEFVRYRLLKAGLLGYRSTVVPRLIFQDGRYALQDDKVFCGHPLEYFLLCEDEKPLIGDWHCDLQSVLGVSHCWVAGFMEGFQENELPVACSDVVEGYRCGTLVAADIRRYPPMETSL